MKNKLEDIRFKQEGEALSCVTVKTEVIVHVEPLIRSSPILSVQRDLEEALG